jgi:PAS domain S-box-containing protein
MRDKPSLAAELGTALFAVAVALGARLVLAPVFSGLLPFFTFWPALFAVAWWRGFRSTFLATLLSIPVLIYFVLPPTNSFQVEQGEHRAGLILFVICGAAIGWLGEMLHRAKDAAENALDHANEKRDLLRVTLASIGDGVVVTDERGGVVLINSVAETLTGWGQDEARGRPLAEVFRIINEDTRRPVADPCEKVLATGTVVGLANHTVLISKDTTERPIDDSAAPIIDDAGKLRGVVVVFRDVSDKRRVDSELRQNERELADFFENAALPLHATGPDGTILRANQGELDMLGYGRDEYIGRNIAEFHVDQRAIAKILARIARGEVMHSYEARLRCKDGSIKDVLVTSSVTWSDGGLAQVRCFTRDITHRKQAEDALVFLARAGSALSALVDRESALQQASKLAVPFLADWCVVYVIDEQKGIDYFAHAHRDPRQEQLLATMLSRFPLDWKSDASSVRALRTGKPQFVENMSEEYLASMAQSDEHLAMIRELGSHSVISVPIRIRDRTIGVIGLVATDPNRRYTPREVGLAESFAERVATAVDNAELFHEVMDANRQKDEFLAMLAHELRNPLAAIRYTVALGKMSNTGPVDELLNIVDRQSQNLARLIDDLLDVSRISRDKVTLQMEYVDAAAVINQAATTVRPLIEQRRHELIVELAKEPMPLFVDPTRAEQIIANLLTNAAKYTPESGVVRVTAWPERGHVFIRVIDNGIGLSPEMCGRVFDLFAQADRGLDRSEGGLGIGLTVARRLAEMHGGSISVESAGLGRGSAFTVRLPLAAQSEGEARLSSHPTVGPPARLRIMVVDDNHDTATSAAMLLRAYGHDVETAYDGPAALELARSFEPHAVLLDIGLPGMNGFEVAKSLRSDGFEATTIVAVSGYGQAEDRVRSQEAGFDYHFVKPVDYSAVLAVLYDAHVEPTLP